MELIKLKCQSAIRLHNLYMQYVDDERCEYKQANN